MIPVIVGSGLGLTASVVMWRSGMLSERSASAVALVAIASFYPVFALAQADRSDVIVHLLIFAAFLGMAWIGYRRGLMIIGVALIAHGGFDAAMMVLAHPAPDWWPAFCAAFDLVLGAAVIAFARQGAADVE